MANLSGIMQQLKKERDRVERELSGLNAALAAFVNVYAGKSKPTTGRKRRKMSVSARKKIAAAQRARWAKARKGSRPAVVGAAKTTASTPTRRTMSASARRKIAAAQRARWAKLKTLQKKAA
jgi:hypothetical protein